MESLTKENFWNELYAKYPAEVQVFYDWIDEYKERVEWHRLFHQEFYAPSLQAKYHDLPIAMQIGIFLQFLSEKHDLNGILGNDFVTEFKDIIPQIELHFAQEYNAKQPRQPLKDLRFQYTPRIHDTDSD